MSAPLQWPLAIRIAQHCTARRVNDIRRHPPLSKSSENFLESVESPCANNAMQPYMGSI